MMCSMEHVHTAKQAPILRAAAGQCALSSALFDGERKRTKDIISVIGGKRSDG